ncbi:MAG: hypothetical protein ACREIV_08800 [Planctomycetaceae bacterium]
MTPTRQQQLERFLKLADELRTAQKRYFATKSAIVLHHANQLEAEVDAQIHALKRTPQPPLFDTE